MPEGRADRGRIDRKKRTDILIAFCDAIKSAGYTAGVYASESWYKNDLDNTRLSHVYRWVAKYSQYKPAIRWDAWQYSDQGRIDGVTGYVDLSQFAVCDAIPDKTPEEVALEVIDGKWGSSITDPTRKERLTAAGYDYDEVQAIVNQIIASQKIATHVICQQKIYYVVRQGDTLSKIAAKHGTSVSELTKLNNFKDPNKIYVGDRIRIK